MSESIIGDSNRGSDCRSFPTLTGAITNPDVDLTSASVVSRDQKKLTTSRPTWSTGATPPVPTWPAGNRDVTPHVTSQQGIVLCLDRVDAEGVQWGLSQCAPASDILLTPPPLLLPCEFPAFKGSNLEFASVVSVSHPTPSRRSLLGRSLPSLRC